MNTLRKISDKSTRSQSQGMRELQTVKTKQKMVIMT